jgi:hypothetical protein
MQLRSEGDWNHLMSELTPELDLIGGENKNKDKTREFFERLKLKLVSFIKTKKHILPIKK